MRLIELTEIDKLNYNRFVTEHNGSFLQSWEWGEWQAALGRQVKRFMFSTFTEATADKQVENGEFVGSIQFIKMPLWGSWYYVYAPYGPVLAASEQTKDLRFKMEEELNEKFPEAMFLRFEPHFPVSLIFNPKSLIKSTNIQPAITMVVDLQKTDEELLAAMHSKTRYNIKVAQRHGVVVESELAVTPGHGLYTSEVVDLIIRTQLRQQYRGHVAEYYRKFIDFFALHNRGGTVRVSIYKALYQRQLLACALCVDFGRTRVYLFGGSAEEHRNVMAPYLLHWQAMQDARALRLKLYDLGGSEVSAGGERGFTRFKQGFGGQVVHYAGAYDLVQHRLWYTIYTFLRRFNKLTRVIK